MLIQNQYHRSLSVRTKVQWLRNSSRATTSVRELEAQVKAPTPEGSWKNRKLREAGEDGVRCKPRLGHLQPGTSETQAGALAASRSDDLTWPSNDFRHEVTMKRITSKDFLLKVSYLQSRAKFTELSMSPIRAHKENVKAILTPYLVPGRDGASETHEQVGHGHKTDPDDHREEAEQLLKHRLDAGEDEYRKENCQGSGNCY